MNTGDHLPVSLTLTLTSNDGVEPDTTTDTIENDFIPNHMWQNKEFITLYRQRVSESIKTHHTKDTETILNELQTTLQNCAAECYTTYQNKFYNFPSKPWWNDDLRKARKNLQLMFNTWRDEGFPRLDSNVSYNRYRFARKIFRTLVKRAKYQATVDHYINVEKLKRIKPTSYWKELKLLQKKQQKLCTLNDKTDKKDIANEFHDHFQKLLNTPRIKDIDNIETGRGLRELLNTLRGSLAEEFHVSETEVANAINKLKNGKSRDPFQIKAEHYIYAQSDIFNPYLTGIINKVFSSTTIPSSLSTSIIIPLVKSHKKSLGDPNNYRGISIIPIITKIFELIILAKCPELSDHNASQFGFASNSSTLNAELIIRDTVSYYNKRDTPVYICSLDAEKAFDCCNWLTLFTKLLKKNIPNAIMSFLIQLYLNGTAMVQY